MGVPLRPRCEEGDAPARYTSDGVFAGDQAGVSLGRRGRPGGSKAIRSQVATPALRPLPLHRPPSATGGSADVRVVAVT